MAITKNILATTKGTLHSNHEKKFYQINIIKNYQFLYTGRRRIQFLEPLSCKK